MAETYQAFYVDEIRALEITINDQTGAPFESDAASASVLDSDGNTVVDWVPLGPSDGGTVSTLIGRTVTANTGNYKIIWRLLQGEYIYYQVTELEIVDL
jgi:hypothetical protein